MKLEEITIESFRSIENQKIILDHNCKGFIGLNESGKSNILSAIQVLNSDVDFEPHDISKITEKMPKVKFHFSLGDSTLKIFKGSMQSSLKPFKPETNKSIFKEFDIKTPVIEVKMSKIKTAFITTRSVEFQLKFKFEKEYLFIRKSDEIPSDVLLESDIGQVPLNSFLLIEPKYLPEDFISKTIKTSDDDFNTIFRDLLEEIVLENAPGVVFWEYDDKYLLPSKIKYVDFMKDDDPYENSAPLTNIFFLSKRLNLENNIEALSDRISRWKTDLSLRRKESLIIKEDLNKYIRSIWPDNDQEIEFELEEDSITILIHDPTSTQKNFYEMEARSQGFKTFISFMLTTAAEFEEDQSDPAILILDEPETHLHPSGVRFMRNELIKLTENGHCVLFATHSIFMIDRRNLKRHYIVEKVNELTRIIPVEKSNITQEAVLYEAMGTSIDEFSISFYNIMFEGDTDLLLFEKFITFCLKHGQKKELLDSYSLQNGGGTKKIEQFFSAKVIPKDSTWIIVLDKDAPGRDLPGKLNLINPSKNYKTECYYYSNIQDFELEDILPKQLVCNAMNIAFNSIGINTNFDPKTINSRPISHIISEFKGRNNVQKEQSNLFEMEFKNNILKGITTILNIILKISTIDGRRRSFKDRLPEYYDFLKSFLNSFFKININRLK